METPLLSIDVLHDQAQRQAGLSDFGPSGYVDGLRILLEALRSEAGLSASGLALMSELVLQGLVNRLYVEDARKGGRFSDHLLPRALVIVGFPRSGTTYLHHLLAQDPESRAIPLWELMAPAHPPRAERGGADDPRMSRVDGLMKEFGRTFAHVNDMNAHLPDRDFWLDRNTFQMHFFSAMAYVPSYQRWLKRQDGEARYDYFRLQLMILSHDVARTRLLLRSPYHLMRLDLIARVLRDARIVHVHRDPAAALGSVCSLTRLIRLEFSDACDLVKLGTGNLTLYLHHAARVRKWRDELPADMFFDLDHDDLVSTPLECIRRIYAYFGMPFTAAFEARAGTFIAENPRHKLGVHSYSLLDYGLDSAYVTRCFADYIQWARSMVERRRA